MRERVQLPEGFTEISAKSVIYSGNTEQGEALLTEYGFSKLVNLFRADTTYMPLLHESWPRINFVCDTPEIVSGLEEMMAGWPEPAEKKPDNWTQSVYMGAIQGFAIANGLVMVVEQQYTDGTGWCGAYVSLLSKDVHDSLPKAPEEPGVM